MRRVVVTGLGMVSPLGMGVGHNWSAITAGKSGLRPIEHFDVSHMSSKIGGIIPRKEDVGDVEGAFDPDKYLEPKEQRKTDIFITYAIAAAHEAIEDAGWQTDREEDLDRTGVMVGSGIGGLTTTYEASLTLNDRGPRRLSPFTVPAQLINLASGQISIKYGYRGPNHSVVTACATGTHAIGDAARLIMMDDADVMIAGGAEAAINPLGVASFAAGRALSTGYNDRPKEASRPWDKDRDGFVIGEGAGILVLEEYEHAKKRGARIYGEVTGYGLSGDAYHITAPAQDGSGGYRAMQAAFKRAKLNPEDIDYVNAHGTSTPLGDGIEFGAVKRLFGSAADKIAMSSTKSAIGHLLGAAGAVEAIYALKAMETGVVPPTLNLHNPSEDCTGINLVPHTAQDREVKTALSNSFGFGGTNASVIFTSV